MHSSTALIVAHDLSCRWCAGWSTYWACAGQTNTARHLIWAIKCLSIYIPAAFWSSFKVNNKSKRLICFFIHFCSSISLAMSPKVSTRCRKSQQITVCRSQTSPGALWLNFLYQSIQSLLPVLSLIICSFAHSQSSLLSYYLFLLSSLGSIAALLKSSDPPSPQTRRTFKVYSDNVTAAVHLFPIPCNYPAQLGNVPTFISFPVPFCLFYATLFIHPVH